MAGCNDLSPVRDRSTSDEEGCWNPLQEPTIGLRRITPQYDTTPDAMLTPEDDMRPRIAARGLHGYAGHGCHVAGSAMDKTARNQLIAVSAICCLFMVVEIVGGVLSNSLALLADAAHLASDLASFLVSLLALWLATKPPSRRLNFGYHRMEILGALFSILMIWVMTGVLVFFAVRRIQPIIHPDLPQYDIKPNDMLITASIGVAFNIVMAFVLHSGFFKKCSLPTSLGHNHSHGDGGHSHGNHGYTSINHDDSLDDSLLDTTDSDASDAVHITTEDTRNTYHSNINIKAAVIHVIGDLIQSVGVLIAAVIIKINPDKYKVADPICTFLFSALVLFTTFTVLKDVAYVVMEASPGSVRRDAVRQSLASLPGVRSVHCLNIWALTVGKVAVVAHLAVDEDSPRQDILFAAGHLLRSEYHVVHLTIQIEDYIDDMDTCDQCKQ